jgi:hypothetical protein
LNTSPIIIEALEENAFRSMQQWKQNLWISSGGVLFFLCLFWIMQQPEITNFGLVILLLLILGANLFVFFKRRWTSRHAQTLVIEPYKIQCLKTNGDNKECAAARVIFKGESLLIGNEQLLKKSPKAFFLLDINDWTHVQQLLAPNPTAHLPTSTD